VGACSNAAILSSPFHCAAKTHNNRYRRNLWTLVNGLNNASLPQAEQAYNDAVIIGFNIGLGPFGYSNTTLSKSISFVSETLLASGPYSWSWRFAA
jgi:hypothetical protein